MSFDYMTPEQFMEYTKLPEAGIAAVSPGDEMTIKALVTLQSSTVNRFSFYEEGSVAKTSWRNYYLTDSGRYKVNKDTGAAVMYDREYKDVVIV